MKLTNEQISALKGKGYILNKDGQHFTCRVVIPAGHLKGPEACKVAEICEKYGIGYFTFTQKLNIEIPGIEYENLDMITKELAEVGLAPGSTGARPRPTTACKGTICRFGLYDTDELAAQLNERFYRGFYDVILPSKFRINICGCPHNCTMPQFSCIGLQGRKLNQVAITLGGTAGNHQIRGQELRGLYSTEEAMDIMEKALNYYRENGQKGERFAQTITRIGFETVEKALIG